MFAQKILANELIDILAAPSYSPEILSYVNKISDAVVLKDFLIKKPKLGVTGTIAKDYVSRETPEAIPYISTKQVSGLYAYIEDAKFISKSADIEWEKCRVNDGDIVINKSGNVGAAAIVKASPYRYVNSVSDIISIEINESLIDKEYLVIYLNSPYGQKQLQRLSGGAIFDHVSLHAIPNIKIYSASILAQKYIGDKVRQAELLRNLSKEINEKINNAITSENFAHVMQTEEKIYGSAVISDLTNRLDPKYYASKAIAAERFAKSEGVKLKNLTHDISNGFEERNFVQQGQIYLTVSEVSSGRMEVKSAPKISFDVDVPSKAIINQRCVLVVRTGSIGTAVKVHALDSKAVISSHLIRLEFKEESIAAAVAIFLNSSVGKILLHKISYGAVQPQIGQDELLNLHIPHYILDIKDKLLELLNQYEMMFRYSQILIQTSKLLVEALIESVITEKELIQAKNALEQGDTSLDRAILSQMNEDGYAVTGSKPLFSDLDEFYDLLEQAKALE